MAEKQAVSRPKGSPLGTPSKEDMEKLKAAHKQLKKAINVLERCKRCFVDIGDREETLAYLVSLYDALGRELGITLPE